MRLAEHVGRNQVEIFLDEDFFEDRECSFQRRDVFPLVENEHGLADGYPSHGTDEVGLGWVEG